MLKKLIIVLIALALATWAGVNISADPGYVLFSYGAWTMEMPLWVFAILFLAVLMVGYFCLRVLHGLRTSGRNWRRWREHRRLQQVQHLLTQGMIAYAERDLPGAEKAFSKAVQKDKHAGGGYLLLSEMALGQHQPELANNYIEKAKEYVPYAEFALSFSRARILAKHAKEKAIAIVQSLRQTHPRQKSCVQFLIEHYQEAGQWRDFLTLLPIAKKIGVMNRKQFIEHQRHAYQKLMQANTESCLWQENLTLWLEMPRAHHHDVEIVIPYVQALCATNNVDMAEKIVKKEIRKKYDSRLAVFFCRLEGKESEKDKHLIIAETWVVQHPNDADLLYALGSLCSERRLWGKARDYLERAMKIRADSETCAALGFVLEQFKETHAAIDIYRQGLGR